MRLSVVIPVHNEEEGILDFCDEIFSVLDATKSLDSDWEVIVVDDGSSDKTNDLLTKLKTKDSRMKVLNLARNSGHMAALSAGLVFSQGEWVVTMDGDGQDPPEVIPRMIKAAQESESEICFAQRMDRLQDPIRHRFFSPTFYALLRRATRNRAVLQAADFRLMSRRVVQTVNLLPEPEKVYRVLVPTLGFKSCHVSYSRRKRKYGDSKYSFVKLVWLARDSLIATSGAPLRWASSALLLTAFASLIYGVYEVLVGLNGSGPQGWASLSLVVSAFATAQALTLAIVCEYLLAITSIARQRPTYQIKDNYGD